MVKRSGDDAGIDMQVDKFKYDPDASDDEHATKPSSFQLADGDEIKNRVIRKAKRSLPMAGAPALAATSVPSNSNPFAKVSLTAGPSGALSEGKTSFGVAKDLFIDKPKILFSQASRSLTSTSFISPTINGPLGNDNPDQALITPEKVRAFVALNKSFDQYLSTLPTDKNIEKWEIAMLNYVAYADELSSRPEVPHEAEPKVLNSQFAAAPPVTAPLHVDEDDGENDEVAEKEEETVVGLNIGDNEELKLSTRAKIMFFDKSSNQWVTKAIGTLLVLKDMNGDNGFLRMQDVRTGRVNFNAPLPKNAKIEVNSLKKSVMFSAFSYVSNGKGGLEKDPKINGGQLTLFLIKVKASEEAQILGKNLSDLV